MNLSWFQSSLLGGVLAAAGMILVRKLPPSMHVITMVGFVGAVFLLLSLQYQALGQVKIPTEKNILIIVCLAGALFWVDNLCRFYAFKKTQNTALVLLTIEVALVSLVLIWDLAKLYRAGKLGSLSFYEIAGFTLGVGSLVLLRMAPERRI